MKCKLIVCCQHQSRSVENESRKSDEICQANAVSSMNRGTYKVRNEIETKRNETKRNQRKRNETKRNETKSTKTKRNVTKSTKWKRNETKPTK
jgi:hypothetical protein